MSSSGRSVVGTPGTTGPTGPAGPAGPAGPNTISTASDYPETTDARYDASGAASASTRKATAIALAIGA